jgi:hypothetical protein|tara:strand:+ start:737 stop:982 length:246 start_codon:yes stop_codon:yes gene_type:complete
MINVLKFLINYINWYVLITAFIIGLFFSSGIGGEPVKIFIYPTQDNKDLLQVKDHSGTCFSFETQEIPCSKENNLIDIPLQ